MFTAAEELQLLARQLSAALAYRSQLEAIMADVDQALSDLATAVSDTAQRVQTDIATLKQQIADAQSLDAADQAKLQATADSIEAQVAGLANIDPAAPPAG